MRALKFVFAAVVLLLAGTATSADCDRCTPDATISTLYEAISVAPGEAWDWPRIRALFVPEGLLASTDPASAAKRIAVSNIGALVERTEAAVAGKGFIEREYRRSTVVHGRLASIHSSFYAKLGDERGPPLYRGLHHFQLLEGEDGWKIVSNASVVEDRHWQLPKSFLP